MVKKAISRFPTRYEAAKDICCMHETNYIQSIPYIESVSNCFTECRR